MRGIDDGGGFELYIDKGPRETADMTIKFLNASYTSVRRLCLLVEG